MNDNAEEAGIQFLKHRLATEKETRDYYRRKSDIHDEGKRLGLSGKELFAYTTAEGRKIPFYYSAALDSVVYEPTPDEVFDAFCKAAKVESFDRAHARKIWDLALKYAHEPRFDEELLVRHREGARRVRNMCPDDVMSLRDRHRQRYS